ncbi:MAG: drug:proton antiporter, partial [Pseudomonadota bacterium]|nr:drug:proton antiporter [Pseudomonadota bacterium]
IEETVKRIEKIETALESRFQEHFVHAMALPNKVDPFPKLAEQVQLPPRAMAGAPADETGAARPRRRSREERAARRRRD